MVPRQWHESLAEQTAPWVHVFVSILHPVDVPNVVGTPRNVEREVLQRIPENIRRQADIRAQR